MTEGLKLSLKMKLLKLFLLEQMNANLRHNFGQRIKSLLNNTALSENDEEMNIEEPEIINEAVAPITNVVITPIIWWSLS